MHEGMAAGAPCPEPRPSFEACYAVYYPEAVLYARMLTGDQQAAEDAVSDAFLKIYRRWDATTIAQPRAYIRRAVSHEVVSGFRRRARERARDRRQGVPAQRYPVDEAIAAFDERSALDVLLRQLPPRQRAAVTLRYLDDLPAIEVARRMGTTVGTVKSNAARGLSALRALMHDTHDVAA